MKINNEAFVSTVAVELLEGLTVQESVEFHDIDASVPYRGLPVWPDAGLPQVAEEQRWLELWHKHQQAVALHVLS
jgi:hypothetical protein